MIGSGEETRETIRPEFNPAIIIDFQGAKITLDTGFLLLREIDERFGILGPIESELEDTRSWLHSKHSQPQMIRQRVYQIAAGYEDCNDADFLRIDPALRLAIGKGEEAGAGQSRLSRLENEVLGTEDGLKALEDALTRSNDALMKRKKKQRLIVDVDSTEDPAHGKQEHVAFNGHFGKNCFHPLFAFTSDGDCLRVKLGPGNAHSADGVLEFLDPIVKRYRSRFLLFWLRGDAAFADPEVYEYCEGVVSRSEVVCPRGVGVSFGQTLPSGVRVKSAVEEPVDGVAEGVVRSETIKTGPFHQRDDGFASFRSRGTPHRDHSVVTGGPLSPSGMPKRSKWQDRRIIQDRMGEYEYVRSKPVDETHVGHPWSGNIRKSL